MHFAEIISFVNIYHFTEKKKKKKEEEEEEDFFFG
jgi:hypothetical protein